MQAQASNKIALNFKEAGGLTSLSPWTLLRAAAGPNPKLKTMRVGRRRLIAPNALEDFVRHGGRQAVERQLRGLPTIGLGDIFGG